jgi:carbon monoxide dehydrogenase subunit G
VGARRQLVETTGKVLALKQTMPDLVILPAHDPTAGPAAAGELRLEATMASFENTVTIRRPMEDVFAFLADFENVPAWNYAIVETRKVSPGPVRVGTTYRQTRSVPRRSEEGFEVTVFEPASRLEVQGEIGPFRARVRYELEPTGSGTRLTNAVELRSSGLLRLVAPLAASRVKSAVAANLDALRQVLERGNQR